jgi:alkanesulfonate monooxygenase SsuD/methylene tetrahydromethanopterin reductase-like flavin-dependent oxidoreductase (luciferase family)
VDFHRRGKILDEQLEILAMAWQGGPISYAGEHFHFEDIRLSPGAYRPEGPRLWIGGQGVSRPVLRRLVRYGHGFHPVGQWSDDDLVKVADGMAEAGRDIAELEFIGGTRAVFPDDESVADIGKAMEPIRAQIEQGFTTFCVKPSQFIDDADELADFCRDVVGRLEAMAV